jgi:hypothetical protein
MKIVILGMLFIALVTLLTHWMIATYYAEYFVQLHEDLKRIEIGMQTDTSYIVGKIKSEHSKEKVS